MQLDFPLDCKKITMMTKKKVGETPTSFTL